MTKKGLLFIQKFAYANLAIRFTIFSIYLLDMNFIRKYYI